ncbi:MAG: type II secretion system protein [Bdellovibrionales bacterium]
MRKRGFTLLEVLVAVAILVGGIIVVASAWSGNFLRIRKATLYNNVALLLERKTNELVAEYRDRPLSEVLDKDGDFGSDLAAYRWTFTTREFVMPDLTSLLVGKDEGNKEEMFLSFIKQTQEFISKSIKEGTVTIYVKSGKKEVPFSVTTYFVDYTQELSLPGLPGGGGTAPVGGGSSTGGKK